MRKLFWLVLACSALCAACVRHDLLAPATYPGDDSQPAQASGIIGNLCPPGLATKGYC